MIRALAGADFRRAEDVLGWPVREALHAYLQHLRREGLTSYRFACLMHVLQAPYLAKGEQMQKPRLRDFLPGGRGHARS